MSRSSGAPRHRSVLVAVVVSVVAIVAGGCVRGSSLTDAGLPANKSTHPLIPPMHNGPIGVFGWTNGVRSITPDGAGSLLFKCTGTCAHVAADWSPDGTRLAFTTGCGPHCATAEDLYSGLYVVDIAHGTDRLVVPGTEIYAPAWSPDGTRIAYVQSDGMFSRMFVVNEDGSGRKPVTRGRSPVGQPSWSPDGSRIVYESLYRLFIVGLDGSAPSALVKGFDPTWSPDGKTIVYFGGSRWHQCDVRETLPDGRHDSSLIDLGVVSKRCGWGVDLAWSPDGTELAALVYQEVAPRKGYSAVFVVGADGSSARSFTGWTAGWSWDGLTWQPVP